MQRTNVNKVKSARPLTFDIVNIVCLFSRFYVLILISLPIQLTEIIGLVTSTLANEIEDEIA